jgi:hypothetical protein
VDVRFIAYNNKNPDNQTSPQTVFGKAVRRILTVGASASLHMWLAHTPPPPPSVPASSHPLRQMGLTPLYIASQNGHLDVVQALVEAGVDVNQTTAVGARKVHRVF